MADEVARCPYCGDLELARVEWDSLLRHWSCAICGQIWRRPNDVGTWELPAFRADERWLRMASGD